MQKAKLIILLGVMSLFSFRYLQKEKPVLYIIGDSTVKNGSGTGSDQLWGWGSFMAEHFDTVRIDVRNHAIGGRSSRTFITDGRWGRILDSLKKGDFVIMQFGHNDGSPLDDTARARGTIKGLGNDSVATYNPIRKINETVHTYGWYMRKMIKETQQKGAIPIVCSPVPRNSFTAGKVKRGESDYAGWSKQLATETSSFFIDLNEMISNRYDSLGTEAVDRLFPKDHTHTNEEGARINAGYVIQGIHGLKQCPLKKYLK